MFRSVVLPVALLGLLCALRVGLWTAVRCASKALSLSSYRPRGSTAGSGMGLLGSNNPCKTSSFGASRHTTQYDSGPRPQADVCSPRIIISVPASIRLLSPQGSRRSIQFQSIRPWVYSPHLSAAPAALVAISRSELGVYSLRILLPAARNARLDLYALDDHRSWRDAAHRCLPCLAIISPLPAFTSLLQHRCQPSVRDCQFSLLPLRPWLDLGDRAFDLLDAPRAWLLAACRQLC